MPKLVVVGMILGSSRPESMTSTRGKNSGSAGETSGPLAEGPSCQVGSSSRNLLASGEDLRDELATSMR